MGALLAAVLLCLLSGLHDEVAGEAERRGTYFITSFLNTNSSQNPLLLVVSHQTASVNVSVRMPADQSFDPILRACNETMTYIELPASVRMGSGLHGQTGIVVETSSDVILYALNDVNGSADAFLVLPTSGLGTEYYVTSYHPSSNRKYVEQIGIVGVSNGTDVRVTLPATFDDVRVTYNGSQNRCVAGEALNLTLGEFATFLLESSSDLSGVHVQASTPLVVLSGDVIAQGDVADDVKNQTRVTGQLLPTGNWGHTFVAMPFAGTSHSVFRVIVRDNATRIHVKKKTTRHQVTSSPPSHVDVHVIHDDYINIETSKPVLVLQYITTHVLPETAGPIMLLLPPVETQRHKYYFGKGGDAVYWGPQKVNLVVAEKEREELSLDGEQLRNSAQKPLHVEGLQANFTALRLTLSGGRHNLTHRSQGAQFSAISYSMPLDTHHTLGNLEPLNTTTNTTTSSSTIPKTSTANVSASSSSSTSTRFPTTASSYPGSTATMSTSRVQRPITPKILVSSDEGNTINEAAAPAPAHAYSSAPFDREGMSPTVIAVIVSLSVALLAVVLCILGFLVAEVTCRRREGAFRRTKVAPFPNQ